MMAETAGEEPFAAYTVSCTRLKTLEALDVYRLLSPEAEVTMWETRYCHLLDGYDGLLQWYRGTGMRPYLESLPDDDCRARFEERFRRRAMEEFPWRRTADCSSGSAACLSLLYGRNKKDYQIHCKERIGMKQYTITLLRGDGIGPEIVAEALKVLDAAGRNTAFLWRIPTP